MILIMMILSLLLFLREVQGVKKVWEGGDSGGSGRFRFFGIDDCAPIRTDVGEVGTLLSRDDESLDQLC